MSSSHRSAAGRHSIRLKGYDYSRTGAYFITIVAQHRARHFGRIVRGRMILSEAGSMVHSILADLNSWHASVHIDAFQVMPDHIHAIVILRGASATTLTTRSVAPRNDETVGAGPRACPRDETNHTPSRRRVGSSPDPHQPIRDGRNQSAPTRYDHRETPRCAISRGSAHPGCRGQARGPAPTVTSSRDGTDRVDNVIAGTVALGDVVQHIKSLTTARYRHAVIDRGWPRFHGRLWQRNYYERIIRDDQALANIRRYIRANPRNWIEPLWWYS